MANPNPSQNQNQQGNANRTDNRGSQPRDGEGRFVDERQARGTDGKNMDSRKPDSSDKQRSGASPNQGRDDSTRNR